MVRRLEYQGREFSEGVIQDLLGHLLGEFVGSGMSRRVYRYAPAPEDYVVKVEEDNGHFQNVLEWEVWQRVQFSVFAKHFAPCTSISDSGRILIQEATLPVTFDELPERMPAFFGDFKMSNFGYYWSDIVCHDYGSTLLMEQGMTKRTKKVKWRYA